MEKIQEVVSAISDFVWGPVMLVFLVGTGIFLTIKLNFLPWRNLGSSLKTLFSKESRRTDNGDGDISPFSALMTALAATVGTGNIVGVATAMVLGGPGALVWMWISAAFGIGNATQANSISSAVYSTFSIPQWVVGLILAVLVALIIIGGIQTISKVSTFLVPAMAAFYIIAGLLVVIINYKNLPSGIASIVSMAFGGKAVAGGVAGTITASVMSSMRYGIARGVFSNEAGLGSAAITAASATSDHHVKQGYINMCGTFIDTIVVCSVTGLAIASSGMLGATNPATGKMYEGAELTIIAFESALGKAGGVLVTIGIILFAFSTILGWEYNGEKALEFLLKKPVFCYIYRVVFSVLTFVGATTTLEIVWSFSDIANGLMSVPNLICLIVLSGVLAKDTKEFQKTYKEELKAKKLAKKEKNASR